MIFASGNKADKNFAFVPLKVPISSIVLISFLKDIELNKIWCWDVGIPLNIFDNIFE